MQDTNVESGLRANFVRCTEHAGNTVEHQRFPLRDLIWVHVVAAGYLGDGLFAFDGRQSHLSLE